jgi:multidrug resistance efflux pump
MADRNPVRRWTLVVLVLCIVIFAYSLFADRLAPYTPQAVVQAYVVGIAPEVAGRVVEINVTDNQQVEAGTLLFRIDREPYEIAVEQAEARLASVGQTIGASTAGVAAAEAKLAEALADRDNVREQATRILTLVEKGTYAKARADQANAEIKGAEAGVEKAEADLEEARQNLGPQGADNPQVREAMAALRQAQLDLVRTEVFAPSDGLVTNLQLTIGQYASAGAPLMTFIDIRDYWVSAEFRENSLGNMEPGDRAEIVFDVLPGQIFPATVETIAWGVARSGQTGPGGEMPTLRNQSGWVRDPQRFPVRLAVATEKAPPGVRYNSQANVIVYAADNPVTSAIGWLWIRLVMILSYVI